MVNRVMMKWKWLTLMGFHTSNLRLLFHCVLILHVRVGNNHTYKSTECDWNHAGIGNSRLLVFIKQCKYATSMRQGLTNTVSHACMCSSNNAESISQHDPLLPPWYSTVPVNDVPVLS